MLAERYPVQPTGFVGPGQHLLDRGHRKHVDQEMCSHPGVRPGPVGRISQGRVQPQAPPIPQHLIGMPRCLGPDVPGRTDSADPWQAAMRRIGDEPALEPRRMGHHDVGGDRQKNLAQPILVAVRIIFAEMLGRQMVHRHGVKRDLATRPEQFRHRRRRDPAACPVGHDIDNPDLEDLGRPVPSGGFEIDDTQTHGADIEVSDAERTLPLAAPLRADPALHRPRPSGAYPMALGNSGRYRQPPPASGDGGPGCR